MCVCMFVCINVCVCLCVHTSLSCMGVFLVYILVGGQSQCIWGFRLEWVSYPSSMRQLNLRNTGVPKVQSS